MAYQLYIRNWWKREYNTTGPFSNRKGERYDLVPHPRARKTIVGYADSIEEARARCKEYNDNIKGENELGRKMEFTSDY